MNENQAEAEMKSNPEHAATDTYSGEASFLYSSKIDESLNVSTACETLVSSEAFSFALDSEGRIYFKDNLQLKCKLLDIDTELNGQGMLVRGHESFINSNPGDSVHYSFCIALDLFLSSKKFFNDDFGFPAPSARIFMRPIVLKFSGDEEYSVAIPHIRLYAGGIMTLTISPASGFAEATTAEVVKEHVNKAHRNIEAVLCEQALRVACLEYQLSPLNLKERRLQANHIRNVLAKTAKSPKTVDFLNEQLEVYDLLNVGQFSLSDLARNLLSMVTRSIAAGKVHNSIGWFSKNYTHGILGNYWHGKPLIYIRSHTRQKDSAAENCASHSIFVKSVMARAVLNKETGYLGKMPTDMRIFDDFNHFYSGAISLMLTSAQLDEALTTHESFTFNNLVSDIHILNEACHYINMFYRFSSIELDNCKNSIDVARIEIRALKLEESLLSVQKFGEISAFFKEVRNEDHLATIYNILTKKIETLRKSFELDEKISSEKNTLRISLIFGIIASATLSPELIQPLAKTYGITFGENIDKLVGIGIAFVLVMMILKLSHYIFRAANTLKRILIK